jgi:hypothetical protein
MASLAGRIMSGVRGAITGFREGFTQPDTPDSDVRGAGLDEWGLYEARRLRYAMGWAFDSNTAYREIHAWSRRNKVEHGLYSAIQGLYNPANRLNTLHAMLTWGGPLDPEAGDGKSKRSALPIDTANERLRPPIAATWRASRWQSRKTIGPRYGAMMGDPILKIVDDPNRRQVRLKVIHPKAIVWVGRRDDDPVPTGYLLREMRPDPEARAPGASRADAAPRLVEYAERVTLDERTGVVTWETYREGREYPWPGNPGATWDEPYGFVPLVLGQHDSLGLEWGQAEFWPQRHKIQAVDDLASNVLDHVRKAVNAALAISGVGGKQDISVVRPDTAPTADNPQPIRTEVPLLLLRDPAAKVQTILSDLDLADVLEHIREGLSELERDLPELQKDIWAAATGSGSEVSGRAMREARKQIIQKISERRSGYDEILAIAQKMAVAMGGHGGYPGYEGFALDDFHADRSPLDHAIGERPVFDADPRDKLEDDAILWTNARTAVSAGYPLTCFLRDAGWSDERIAEFEVEQEADAARANADGLLSTQTNVSGSVAPDSGAINPPVAKG